MGESVERTESGRGCHEEKGGLRETSKESYRTHVTGKNGEDTGEQGLCGGGNREMGRQPKISMYENAIKEGKYCKIINKKYYVGPILTFLIHLMLNYVLHSKNKTCLAFARQVCSTTGPATLFEGLLLSGHDLISSSFLNKQKSDLRSW